MIISIQINETPRMALEYTVTKEVIPIQPSCEKRVRALKNQGENGAGGWGVLHKSATTDLWSGATTSEPYISYTVHFINQN